MEICDPYGLFVLDGKNIILRDNSEGLERICKRSEDALLFSVKDELYEFKSAIEKNRFVYEYDKSNNLFLCYLTDKNTGIKSIVGYMLLEDEFLQSNNSEFCYGVFGHLIIHKSKIKNSKGATPLYSEFIQKLSRNLCNNGTATSIEEIYDNENFKLLCFGKKEKARFITKSMRFESFHRSLLLNADTDNIILLKYISRQYNKLELELIKLELEYLSEIHNAASKIINGEKDYFLVNHDALFEDKLKLKSDILENRFKGLIEEGATGAIYIHENEIKHSIDLPIHTFPI